MPVVFYGAGSYTIDKQQKQYESRVLMLNHAKFNTPEAPLQEVADHRTCHCARLGRHNGGRTNGK